MEPDAGSSIDVLHRVFDATIDGIVACLETGEISLANKSIGRHLGVSPKALVGCSLGSFLVPGESVETARAANPGDGWVAGWIQEHLGGGNVSALLRCLGEGSSSLFSVTVKVSKIDQGGGEALYAVVLRDVTNEREAMAKLEVEALKTKAILNSAVNAIITVDPQGNVELFNSSARLVFGYSAEEAETLNLAKLIYRPEDMLIDAEGGWMPNFLVESAGTVVESVGIKHDMSEFPLRMTVSQVKQEGFHLYTVILRDITEEQEQQTKEMEESIMAAEDFAAILNTTVDAIVVTDAVGTLFTFNAAAEKIFGWASDEIVGHNVSVLMSGRHSRKHGKYMAHYNQTGISHSIVGYGREVEAMRKDGSIFRCHLAVGEVFVSEGNKHFTATIRDITNEQLLMNMLPSSIAVRLKAKETPINDGFEDVSILFADVVGFTALSSKLEPMEVVTFLNDVFSRFDELADLYQLEKIKTIGDCYMVVSGMPEPREDHAQRLACFSLDMIYSLKKYNEEACPKYPLDMRVGMNCGPVVAGVVGKRKFLYDLWGDSVNIASRMESSGKPGLIQVTDAFFEHTKEWFSFEERGTIAVKGKGEMRTWWLEGPRPDKRAELLELVSDGRNNLLEIVEELAHFKPGVDNVNDEREMARRAKAVRRDMKRHTEGLETSSNSSKWSASTASDDDMAARLGRFMARNPRAPSAMARTTRRGSNLSGGEEGLPDNPAQLQCPMGHGPPPARRSNLGGGAEGPVRGGGGCPVHHSTPAAEYGEEQQEEEVEEEQTDASPRARPPLLDQYLDGIEMEGLKISPQGPKSPIGPFFEHMLGKMVRGSDGYTMPEYLKQELEPGGEGEEEGDDE